MRGSADLEVGDTAGLETCATTDRQFESHPAITTLSSVLALPVVNSEGQPESVRHVAQRFLSAGDGDFPVSGHANKEKSE